MSWCPSGDHSLQNDPLEFVCTSQPPSLSQGVGAIEQPHWPSAPPEQGPGWEWLLDITGSWMQ